jgi:hypothetical protein
VRLPRGGLGITLAPAMKKNIKIFYKNQKLIEINSYQKEKPSHF